MASGKNRQIDKWEAPIFVHNQKFRTMIGAAIGAATQIAGSILGGRAAAKAAKQANKLVNQQMEDNQAWYDKRYNENFLQRSDAQQALNYAREQADKLYKRAEGSAVVSGATDESLALQKEAGNELLADTTSNIAAQADAYKQQVEGQYLSTKSALNQQKLDILQQKAQGIANAVGGVSSAVGGIAGGLTSILGGGK